MSSLMQVKIDQQRAEIGISSRPASMQISHPKKTFRTNQEIPQPDISIEIPKFQADHKRINADMNIHSALDFTKQQRDKGNRKRNREDTGR